MTPDQPGRASAIHEADISAEATVGGTQCATCRRVHVPARTYRCLGCGSTSLSAMRVELRGVFESWTRPPGSEPTNPAWALALVKLDAGPMLTVRARLNGVAPRVGARVAGTAERPEGAPERFWFELLEARHEGVEDRPSEGGA
jgi:uncharacterized OB-fold protein